MKLYVFSREEKKGTNETKTKGEHQIKEILCIERKKQNGYERERETHATSYFERIIIA